MAVSSEALTIADHAIMSNDPLVMKITKSLLINGIVLADIPMLSKKTLLANGVRWEGNLPTVNWQKLNTEPTVTKGKPTPYQEQAYLVRNAIDVDIKILEDENLIMDPRVSQLEAYITSLVYDFNDKFINNSHTSGDANAPVGLRERLDNPTVYGVASELKINGGAVDMSQGGMTATTANTFIELVQTVLDYFGRASGDGVVFYLNDTLQRRWERAIRVLGAGAGFTMTKDAFDRDVLSYRNARIVNVGRKADQSTQIILNTEASTGAAGASVHTSMYACCYGEERLVGWQFESIADAIKDLGLIGNAGTIARILIDWAMGLLPQHTRCMARVYGIKVA